jgi:hypothetical protein
MAAGRSWQRPLAGGLVGGALGEPDGGRARQIAHMRRDTNEMVIITAGK